MAAPRASARRANLRKPKPERYDRKPAARITFAQVSNVLGTITDPAPVVPLKAFSLCGLRNRGPVVGRY